MLTPKHILDTAKRDLAAMANNRALKQDRLGYRASGASSAAAGKSMSMGFLPKHVSGSSSASDVIKNAIADRKSGAVSKIKSVAMLYSDADILAGALELAKASEAGT